MATWGARQEGLAVGPSAVDALWPGASPLPGACALRPLLRAPVLPVGPAAQVLCGLRRLSGTALPSPPGSLLARGEACPMLPSAPLIKMLPVVF